MTDKTAAVNLTLYESGVLYHMLIRHLMEQSKSDISSMILTADVCEAIRRREIALLKKLGAANDELLR